MAKSKKIYFSGKIEVDAISVIRQIARKEFEERRACQRSEIDQYVKTICELQRAVKSLKTQVDRLESKISI